MTKSEKKHASKNTLALLLIALPGITYLIINNYIPIIGTFIAFKKFSYAKGIWGSPWCGLNNFKFLFLTDDAWVITRNTLLYNLAFIVIGTVVSVIFAILLHELGELLRGKFFQSVLLFPHLLSWVVTAYLVYALLGSTTGFVNNTILNALGKKGVDTVCIGSRCIEDNDTLLCAVGKRNVVDAGSCSCYSEEALRQLHAVHGCTSDENRIGSLQALDLLIVFIKVCKAYACNRI